MQLKDTSTLKDELEEFLNTLFYHHLQASPKAQRVVICESMLTPRPFMESIAEVLFERFEVGPVYFLLSNLLPLYCTGLHSGMVVDVGFCGAQIATFAHARVCMEGFSYTSSTGGLHLDHALRERL